MVYTSPLLAQLYTLNQSCGKRVTVGLEYDCLSDHRYKPVVRLLAKDHEGIALDVDNWKSLKEIFEDIHHYLNGSGKNLEDQRCYGDSWTVRFNFICKK